MRVRARCASAGPPARRRRRRNRARPVAFRFFFVSSVARLGTSSSAAAATEARTDGRPPPPHRHDRPRQLRFAARTAVHALPAHQFGRALSFVRLPATCVRLRKVFYQLFKTRLFAPTIRGFLFANNFSFTLFFFFLRVSIPFSRRRPLTRADEVLSLPLNPFARNDQQPVGLRLRQVFRRSEDPGHQQDRIPVPSRGMAEHTR